MKKTLIFTCAMLLAATSTPAKTAKHSHGIDLSNMNAAINPGTDFYGYATGKWNEKNPMPADRSRYGAFDQLNENNNTRIKELVEEMAQSNSAEGSLEQKIGILYNKVLDSKTLNEQGIAPLMVYINQLDQISQKEHVIYAAAIMARAGISAFFNFGVDADEKNSKINLVAIGQGGITLPERDYYLDTDAATLKARNAYREYGKKVFSKIYPNLSEEEATKRINDVIRLETRMASSFYSKEAQRIPENNYHKMTYAQFQKTYQNINWNTFFEENKFPQFDEINVMQPEALACVNKIIKDENIETLKNYLTLRVATAALPYLSDELRQLHFDFFSKTMTGAEQEMPAWKRGVQLVQSLMGEALGKVYVKKYFPEEAKQKMEKLVSNLQTSLKERILAQDWMSEETKQKAVDKLATFYVKIGYPDKWRDYSNVNFNTSEPLLKNVIDIRIINSDYEVNRTVGKPVDKDRWYMTPQTVNAYYNPTTNEICFPAGILQYPFFDMEADDAFNYGAIGVVIGHEMTHGFDDQGRKFDKEGNMHEWWTPEDATKFNARAQVIIDFFNTIQILPGLYANGAATQGENLADHGGLQVAYNAFKKATAGTTQQNFGGLTPDQRFFIAYAGVWAGDIREAEVRRRTKTDVHSLAKWRVNGTLPHIDTWYKAFHITSKDKLYLPESKRLNIW